jgi:hypothetical protein
MNLSGPAPTPAPSTVGSVNGYAQLPITADMLRTTPETLNDPSLGSRKFTNPLEGMRQPVASASVFAQPDVPPYLQNALASLNAEQALRRSMQAELTNRIVAGAQSGGPNAYLWQEALRAAAVTPGAHVNFGQSVQNPLIGQGYYDASEAYKQRAAQQTRAITAANTANQNSIIPPFEGVMQNPGGAFNPAYQAYINRQIMANQTASPGSSVQQLGRSAAYGGGWTPMLPSY